MHQRSLISAVKILSKHPFQRLKLFRFSLSSTSSSSSSIKSFSGPFSFQNPPNPYFLQSLSLSSSAQLDKFQSIRLYSAETDREVDKINLKFAEAREEIESALESKETVYFDEEAECARAAVKEVLDMYEGLLGKLPENEKGTVQRSMGLKIEQLKAELAQLNE